MVRNVVMVQLRPGSDMLEIGDIQEGLRSLDCPGTLSYTVGGDLGLREGNWDFAIVADFVDSDAYRQYDLDEEHNNLRARMEPMVAQVARLQFEVADA